MWITSSVFATEFDLSYVYKEHIVDHQKPENDSKQSLDSEVEDNSAQRKHLTYVWND